MTLTINLKKNITTKEDLGSALENVQQTWLYGHRFLCLSRDKLKLKKFKLITVMDTFS